jgi:hypothetical protein
LNIGFAGTGETGGRTGFLFLLSQSRACTGIRSLLFCSARPSAPDSLQFKHPMETHSYCKISMFSKVASDLAPFRHFAREESCQAHVPSMLLWYKFSHKLIHLSRSPARHHPTKSKSIISPRASLHPSWPQRSPLQL